MSGAAPTSKPNLLDPGRLILPLFVLSGTRRREPSRAIKEVESFSPDMLSCHVEGALSAGVSSFLLFGRYEEGKDNDGTPASDAGGPVQRALKILSATYPEATVFSHVSLVHSTDHGLNYCRLASGRPDLERTRRRFLEISQSHLESGAHGVIPLFLERGFIRLLRGAMDEKGFRDRMILGYGAKFDSALYGPFNKTTAITEKGMPHGQIDPSDAGSALSKASADIREGTSALVVKPALPYLDIISRFGACFEVPVVGWIVSGEYMMVKSAAERGLCDERKTFLEAHSSVVRAGADQVVTYDALRLAGWIREGF